MFPALSAHPQGLAWVALSPAPWQLGAIPAQHARPMLDLEHLRRREAEALLAITAQAHQQQLQQTAQVPPTQSTPRKANTSASGGVTKSGAPRLSRWRRDKSRMGTLEQQVQEKVAQAEQAEQDNFNLRMRAEALEHAVAAHELQMAMLNRSLQCSGKEASNQLAHRYREFVKEASLLMLNLTEQGNTPADQPVLNRLAEMVTDFRKVVTPIYIQNPGIQFSMIAKHLDAPAEGDPPPPEEGHWQQVADKIGATNQQLDEIKAMWDLTEEAMTKMQVEAQDLSRQLEKGLRREPGCELMELGKKMSALTFRQAMLYFSFSYSICGRIFTPLQVARAMVHSFPYFLDTRQLVAHMLRSRRASSGVSGGRATQASTPSAPSLGAPLPSLPSTSR